MSDNPMRVLKREDILALQETEAEQQRQAEMAAYIAQRDAHRAASRSSAWIISDGEE